MAAAANAAPGGGKSDGDKKNEATALAPPPARAGSTWPRALRIDVELAENHGRRTGAAGGLGRIDEKNRSTTVTTKRPPSNQSHRRLTCNLAESGGGGDEKTREVAGLRVDVEPAESYARAEGPAVVATGGIGRLRDLLENRRRSGIITRSTGRRTNPCGIITPKNVVIDGEDKKMAPGDRVPQSTAQVPQTLGGAGGGGVDNNGDKANDVTCSRSAVKRVLSNVGRRYWSDQEGAAVAGGGEVAGSTGVGISLQSGGGQGRTKKLRHGGVTEAWREKVNGDDSRTHLELSLPPIFHHHQLEPRTGIDDEVQHHQHRHHQLLIVGPTMMDEVAALMSQALATVAMASAVSASTESIPITTTSVKKPLIPPPPTTFTTTSAAGATAATIAPRKGTTTTTTTTTPPQPQGQNSKSASREANAAYIELGNFASKIDDRCAAAIKTLHAASRAVASPGEELNRSYDAYCNAYRSLYAAQGSVRDAEEQEDAAVDELRRVCEIVDAAEGDVARAAKSLRDFDAGRVGRSGISSNVSSKNDAAKKKQKSDGGGDDDVDGDCDGSDRERKPPPALPDEVDPLKNRAHKYDKSSRARETLRLALETAGSNADRAAAERYRVQEAALAAMTLVGARTAGEWSLASDACDAVKKRFQRAGLEAIPKIKLFSEEARLFRNLNKLRGDTRQRLSAASQAREESLVAAAEAEAVAVTVARRMSAPVATAVAMKAAAEAAARAAAGCGGDGENAPLSAPAVKQEEKEDEEEEEDGREEGGENDKEREE